MRQFLIITTLTCIALLKCDASFAKEPLNELYWKINEYPGETFQYIEAEEYQGGKIAIDYACQQNAGSSGTYTGTVLTYNSSGSFPAQKSGYCMLRRPFIPGTYQGRYYTASLYCNGEKKEMMDNSPCNGADEIEKNKNEGPPECPSS